jgi:hypothetical protein
MLLQDWVTAIKHAVRIEPIVDLGLVHVGKIGYAKCEVSAFIEHWEQAFYFALSVEHQKSGGSRTSVIKWPFSRYSPTDLEGVVQDFGNLSEASTGQNLTHDRGWAAKCVDKLTRTEFIGDYTFRSPLTERNLRPSVVKASVVRPGSHELEVWLTEYRPSGVFMTTQIPHAACEVIVDALENYRAEIA